MSQLPYDWGMVIGELLIRELRNSAYILQIQKEIDQAVYLLFRYKKRYVQIKHPCFILIFYVFSHNYVLK